MLASTYLAIEHRLRMHIDRYLNRKLTEEEITEFWHQYEVIDYYLRYIRDCNNLNIPTLNWEQLHRRGLLCDFAYMHIPEAKEQQNKPMDLMNV